MCSENIDNSKILIEIMITLPSITELFPQLVDTAQIVDNFINSKDKPNEVEENEKDESKNTKHKGASTKVKFTKQEDTKLSYLASTIRPLNWNIISSLMGTRSPRQCRDRWKNYLNPEIWNNPWTEEEDRLLWEKQLIFGTKWGKISRFFVRRSDNNCRNRWQYLYRKMKREQNNEQVRSQNF